MAQFRRLGSTVRAAVHIELDGKGLLVRAGDTVLTAILTHDAHLRDSEFGDGPRAGFCLMGACQDCLVWLGRDLRVRACDTFVADGMKISRARP